MNEEQRAVLAAIGRMEQGSALIDEYTVARDAGIIGGELPSQDYVHSQERARIRQIFEELERGGMIRLSREGYWRPRTTLAGRRAWQNPEASLLPQQVVAPDAAALGRTAPTAIPDIFGDDDDDLPSPAPRQRATPEEGSDAPQAWPGWWPAALRIGDPGLTPLVGSAAAGLVALLLVIFVASRVVGGARATPTPTISAVSLTATAVAAQPPPPSSQPAASGSSQPSAGASAGRTPGASPRPSTAPSATQPRQPTATTGPQSTQVRIANTELQGAFLYATPAGERTKEAIPEGTLVDIAGPDERDTQGRNWKHVVWGSGTYWLLEEYTTPGP